MVVLIFTVLNFTLIFSSEAEEEPTPPPLIPAPCKQPQIRKESEKPTLNKTMPAIIPSFTIPTVQQHPQNGTARPGNVPSIPLPLLILNSLQPQQQQQHCINQEKKDAVTSSSGNGGHKIGNGTTYFIALNRSNIN